MDCLPQSLGSDTSDNILSRLSRKRTFAQSSDESSQSEPVSDSFRQLYADDDLYDPELVAARIDPLTTLEEEARRAYAANSRYKSLRPAQGVCSWAKYCVRLRDRLEKTETRLRKKQRIVSRYDHFSDPLFGTDTCEGDERLEAINYTLDSFRWVRTDAQVMFHTHFTQAMLRRIYGQSWDANAVRVLQEHGLKKIKTEVMIMTPRRYGKTVAVSMWVVAALLNIPGIEIGIFSTGQRASSMLMSMAAGFLREIQGAEERLVKLTDRDMFVALNPRPEGTTVKSSVAQQMKLLPSTSKLHSFPSTVESKCVCVLRAGREGLVVSSSICIVPPSARKSGTEG